MLPVHDILEQARRARDPRFDGRFFIGVRTTGIYCRPVCPVKMPKRENVAFFATAAAASEAGFRPCLRCRPEASPGTPAWMGTSTTVARALKLIDGGALDEGSMPDLADRLGVTARHLNRLFRKHLGASAKTIAQTRRLQFAKQLIDETSLPMTAVAMSAGYGSIRRFNDHFRHTYQRAPASLRRGSMSGATDGEAVQLKLAYRTPYDFAGMLDFLRVRSIPGLEEVTGNVWRRVVGTGDRPGRISVRDAPEDSALLLAACGVAPRELMSVANRVRKMFDLDAVPAEINGVFARDKRFFKLVDFNPGQRLPGGWDPFETAVRAVVGQQISVKAATTVMGKIVELYGEGGLLDDGSSLAEGSLLADGSTRCFPTPDRLAEIVADSLLADGSLPMPSARAATIGRLAQQVRDGQVSFDATQKASDFIASLTAIKGIGPWTAQYIAMRALGDPDVFLPGDLVVKKSAARRLGIATEQKLIARAEAWRPWRAYAVMHLWRTAAKAPRVTVPNKRQGS